MLENSFREMTEHVDADTRGLLARVRTRFSLSPKVTQEGMLGLLRRVLALGGVRIRYLGYGFGLCTRGRDGDCGYFGIGPSGNIVVWLRGKVDDPRRFFPCGMGGVVDYRLGLTDGRTEEIEYVARVLAKALGGKVEPRRPKGRRRGRGRLTTRQKHGQVWKHR